MKKAVGFFATSVANYPTTRCNHQAELVAQQSSGGNHKQCHTVNNKFIITLSSTFIVLLMHDLFLTE
jgi:hypothetical protein